MKFDYYTIVARLFPAIIASLPFVTLYFFSLRLSLGDFLSLIGGIKFVSDVTTPLVAIFLLMQLGRIVSKELVEKKLFYDGLNLPTTNYLLHLDTHFSSDYTKQIHKRVQSDFGITLSTPRVELNDEIASRKKVTEAVNMIRAKVGSGNLVLQHNSEYGFARNLVGCSVFALMMSIVNLVVFSMSIDRTPLIASMAMTAAYLSVLIFRRALIVSFGNGYAKVLIQEYMALP